MALIDSNEELGNVSEIEAEDFKQQSSNAKQTPQPSEEQAPQQEIPEKYKGKNLEDIVRMHQEAEKLIGRQAQEVGEVRRLADDLIKQSIAQKNQQQVQPNEVNNASQEIDFFEDPQSHVNRAVANHPDVIAAKQASLQLKQIQTQAMLNKKHPDFADIVRDGEFIEWVKASPMRLYARS